MPKRREKKKHFNYKEEKPQEVDVNMRTAPQQQQQNP